MDPISFTASLLALIHAANALVQGLHKAYAYRGAPRELDRLLAELQSLEELLRNIKAFTELNPSLPFCETLGKPLERASVQVANIETILSASDFHWSKLSDANKARITWFRYKERFMMLEKEVNNVKLSLGIGLGLITA